MKLSLKEEIINTFQQAKEFSWSCNIEYNELTNWLTTNRLSCYLLFAKPATLQTPSVVRANTSKKTRH